MFYVNAIIIRVSEFTATFCNAIFVLAWPSNADKFVRAYISELLACQNVSGTNVGKLVWNSQLDRNQN